MSKKRSKNKVKDIENDLIQDTSTVEDSEFVDEMKHSYLDYSMLVIKGRALPDVRDGLKPVHRRILYAMKELSLYPNSPYRKSARVVGDVLGKYHPHGDSAVYLAMVRMAQDFKNNLPLIDGHGNFGSVDGDSPAQMRYTESRMSDTALLMLEELKYNVVDFKNNFDDTEKEPIVLPNKIPGLLINGVNGVAVGINTKIPPHNPTEVIDGYIAFINNRDISIDRLCEYIPAPDFPTGGTIVNTDEFKSKFYHKGEATIRIRSKYHIEDAGYGKKNIVITEVPFTISGSINKNLLTPLLDMVVEKKLDECSDIRDESGKDGTRIVIETKRGVNTDKLIKKLLSKTNMEDTEKYTILALNENNTPIYYNLKTYFEDVLKFQEQFYVRKYKTILEKTESKKEILEGYITAYDSIRVIIEIILNTKGKNAEECNKLISKTLMHGDTTHLEDTEIMKKHLKIAKDFRFTERQVKSILSKQLSQLSTLEVDKYKTELETVNKTIAECQSIITNEKELHKVIKKELRDIKKKLHYDRKTDLDNIDKSVYKETLKIEDLLILIDDLGYLKVLDVPKNFSMESYSEYKLAKIVKNTDSLRFLTNKGNYIQLKLLSLEKTKNKDRGRLFETYLDLAEDEKVLFFDTQSSIINNDLIVLTKKGFLKRMDCIELDTVYTNISYTKFDEDDEVLDLLLIDRDLYYDLKIYTAENISKILSKDNIKFTKKGAKGNRILKEVSPTSMELIPKKEPEIETSDNDENIQEAFMSFDLDGNLNLIDIE